MKTAVSKRWRLHSLTFMNQHTQNLSWTPFFFSFFSSLLLWTSEVWWVSCVLNHSLNLRSSECLKNSSFTHGDHRVRGGSNFLKKCGASPQTNKHGGEALVSPLLSRETGCSGSKQIYEAPCFSQWHRKDLHVPCQEGLPTEGMGS